LPRWTCGELGTGVKHASFKIDVDVDCAEEAAVSWQVNTSGEMLPKHFGRMFEPMNSFWLLEDVDRWEKPESDRIGSLEVLRARKRKRDEEDEPVKPSRKRRDL